MIYNILMQLTWALLHVAALFDKKLKLFVVGRKRTFEKLQILQDDRKKIWVHAASLGEFEQGLPIIERIKKDYADHQIILTFFSPSGYEVKKDTPVADLVTYLPFDTKTNARRFITNAKPALAIFIKYEVWPNYLAELQHQSIPTFLVSALFKPSQIYFKFYGGFMRKTLERFDHHFVQNEASKKLLASIGMQNVTISGDTRFDRVAQILERDNHLHFMERFTEEHRCLVAGSTWPEDERVLIPYINANQEDIKFVIAPHNIKTKSIENLAASISKKTVLFSALDGHAPIDGDVLIIDTIGLLTKIYAYADIAYVGGGFATGLHNTLEPAVYGIPVIIGPKYHEFAEAETLVNKGGILPITNAKDFSLHLNRLWHDPDSLNKAGQINSTLLRQQQGATDIIMEHLAGFL